MPAIGDRRNFQHALVDLHLSGKIVIGIREDGRVKAVFAQRQNLPLVRSCPHHAIGAGRDQAIERERAGGVVEEINMPRAVGDVPVGMDHIGRLAAVDHLVVGHDDVVTDRSHLPGNDRDAIVEDRETPKLGAL